MSSGILCLLKSAKLPSYPMNPHSSPRAAVPPGQRLHEVTGRVLAVPPRRVGVAIVDDDEDLHVLVRDILDQTREFYWVGSYSSAAPALNGIPQSRAQIVLIDIKMPGMSGIDCARRLKEVVPHLSIVMVTGLADPWTIHLARENGADEFLAKPFSPGQCLAALLFCLERSKSAGAAPSPISRHEKRPPHREFGARPLTTRENKLLEYIAEGLLNKEIADRMQVSVWVVHKLQSSAFKKLGARNRTEAVRYWRQ